MPLMMDEDMEVDMDDLFGDGTGLSLPSRPPTKELHQRVDELRGSGSCQGIAWSKWGSIASINSAGTGLELRNLRCHPRDGSWDLSEPTVTPQLATNLDGGPLKHLSWSPTGSELAVVDSAGRVTILQIFSSLNKPTLARPCLTDSADDLHAVVGSFWLNLGPVQNRMQSVLHGPAIKEASGYRYEASRAPIMGPSHPNPAKSAFVYVTTNGSLRVLYPQNNNKWFEAHTELESIVSSDDLITHAAICGDKTSTLWVAFATASKQLRTIRALIDWGLPKTSEKSNPATAPVNASIRIKPLTSTTWVNAPGDNLNTSHIEPFMTQLSHLEFLSACGDAQGRISPPTILAIRSYLPGSTSHYNQEVHTIIDRWEVKERQQAVHSAFEHLSSRRSSIATPPSSISYLKKLESITINKIIVGLQTINLGKVICFAYSDSSVDYRDRITMAETFNDGDLDRVVHLSQIGFSYTEDEPCLQVALSPSYCSIVQIRNDGKVKWKQLDYHMGEIGTSMEEPRYAAMVAALALSCSTAVMKAVNNDDIIATAHRFAKNNFTYDWLTELSRILQVHVDYSEEAHYDVLIRNTTIQLCLSIQNSLGFNGDFNPRDFSGKFAWLVLQLRNIVVLVTMAANMKVPGPTPDKTSSPLEDPEVINALAGSVRWVLDLMAWITDTLLTLPNTLPPDLSLTDPSQLSLPTLLNHLHSTNNISLHLLLSSPTRGFLTAICRRLQHLDYIARKAISTTIQSPSNPNSQQPNYQPISPALRAAYLQIAQLTTNTIIRIKTFETLLSSLTSLVKNAYASTKPPLTGNNNAEKARNNLEIKMLFGGEIPAAFKPVIVELFKGIDGDGGDAGPGGEVGLLESVRQEIDPAKLWFADFSMLEVDEDEIEVGKRKKAGRVMDCFRKTWLVIEEVKGKEDAAAGNGKRWRRCARCAAVMEDVLSHRNALQWLVMQQRRCYCSGYWDTFTGSEGAV
ncbi:RNA polymerase ii mediator complex subunit sin4 protein [Rutstroemia sp. NJR-2017a BVV2]|nr:RNA polymerase ii mediator complex subunit sin4 protein [Rutstroemia sp. NJR-2017a BVV2]